MIRVTVLYPHADGVKFDFKYYTQEHMSLVKAKLQSFGLLRVEVDRGLTGMEPETPPSFVCIAYLYFNSISDFYNGMAAHGAELIADIPNYTDLVPQLQVSEMVE